MVIKIERETGRKDFHRRFQVCRVTDFAFDLKTCICLWFLFLQDGYIQWTKPYLLWGVKAVIATLRLSLVPREPLAKQTWLTTSSLGWFPLSSAAMSPATHSSPSFCSQWGEVSTQHPLDPTALEIIPCRNQSQLSNQIWLELACWRVLCALQWWLWNWTCSHGKCCVLAMTTRISHRNQIGNSTSSDTFSGGSHYSFITAV